MTPIESAAKWRGATTGERASAQSHFLDPRAMLGEPGPTQAHEAWARGTGTQLREVEPGLHDTPATCFDTFRFPCPTNGQREVIAVSARELVRLRDGWLNPPGLDPDALGKRTLTNLFSARPAWLEPAHAALDRALLAACG